MIPTETAREWILRSRNAQADGYVGPKVLPIARFGWHYCFIDQELLRFVDIDNHDIKQFKSSRAMLAYLVRNGKLIT